MTDMANIIKAVPKVKAVWLICMSLLYNTPLVFRVLSVNQ